VLGSVSFRAERGISGLAGYGVGRTRDGSTAPHVFLAPFGMTLTAGNQGGTTEASFVLVDERGFFNDQ
jgi:hypothetical protein